MSAIPPNSLASIIQSSGSQHHVSETKRREAAEQAERNRSSEFSEHLQDIIENTDRDSSVHTDGGGLGGQGRNTGESGESPQETPAEEEDSAGGALDIQA